MALFAEMTHLGSGELIAWLAIGLVTGWLAGMASKGGGYGFVGDIVAGLAGAGIAGVLFGSFSHGPQPMASTAVIAFLGACLLIGCGRLFAGGRVEA